MVTGSSCDAPQQEFRIPGTVHYSDQLQILVKWDDGRSQRVKPGIDLYRIIE